MAYDERSLRGVGGWLAFFILTLTVFGPLRGLAQTYGNLYGDPTVAAAYADRWVLLQGIEWSLMAVVIGASLYLGWRMYSVHVWRSVQLTIAGLWLLTPTVQLSETVAVSLITGLDLRTLFDGVGVEMARGLIYAAIWTAYLSRSRRVANTYAPYPVVDELEAVFD